MAYSPADELEAPRLTPAVLWLIALNVAIYFVQVTVQGDLWRWLGFSADAFATHAWTAVTYMFAHFGFFHLALNMYTLWAFGPRLERAWRTKPFLAYYLWCGLGGVLAHFMFVRESGPLVGASAAIFGVILAYALRWPDDEVYFFGIVPMKVKWLVGFLVVVNLVFGLLPGGAEVGGGTAYMAHLGGLAFGGLYFLRPTAPGVERLRQRVAAAPDTSDDPPRAVPRTLPRPRERGSEADEVVAQSKALAAQPPRPAPPPRPVPLPPSHAQALDAVLDKISERGIESLTSEERRLLEEASRQLRNG